ncbi:hypothetical protein AAFF_G00304550 [Aldrovandia affinis]|uniref:Uncharacterized protein n=1 Tax=Aldrovandia affinis TaxID=143900 RepID=A0AAD7SP11_9TELE|nr:hypothetical protein AAFF_G00304550 [Aldrovandia affinis]
MKPSPSSQEERGQLLPLRLITAVGEPAAERQAPSIINFYPLPARSEAPRYLEGWTAPLTRLIRGRPRGAKSSGPSWRGPAPLSEVFSIHATARRVPRLPPCLSAIATTLTRGEGGEITCHCVYTRARVFDAVL